MINDNRDNQKPTIYSQLAKNYLYNSKKKRTELGQIIQILEYIRTSTNTIISSIGRYANMSHSVATKNCERLAEVGLLSREITHNNRKYRLTSEGMSFLNDCRNFESALYTHKLNDVLYYY
jgi:predicted transcriptional regulator